MISESNRVEFKQRLSDKFERSVIAFLNYPGGGEILTIAQIAYPTRIEANK